MNKFSHGIQVEGKGLVKGRNWGKVGGLSLSWHDCWMNQVSHSIQAEEKG